MGVAGEAFAVFNAGGGVMGGGIAAHFANAGLRVLLGVSAGMSTESRSRCSLNWRTAAAMNPGAWRGWVRVRSSS